jgi:hypothetical protein
VIRLEQLFAVRAVDGFQVEAVAATVAVDGPLHLSELGSGASDGPFAESVPSGRWPATVLVAERGDFEGVVAFRVTWSDAPAVGLRHAVRVGEDARLLAAGQAYGLGFRGGVALSDTSAPVAPPDGGWSCGARGVAVRLARGVATGWWLLDGAGDRIGLIVDLGVVPVDVPAPPTDRARRRAAAAAWIDGIGTEPPGAAAVGWFTLLADDATGLVPALAACAARTEGHRRALRGALGAVVAADPEGFAGWIATAPASLLDAPLRPELRPSSWSPAVIAAILARWVAGPPAVRAPLLRVAAWPANPAPELLVLAVRSLGDGDAEQVAAALTPFATTVWTPSGRRPFARLPGGALPRVVALLDQTDPQVADEAARALEVQGHPHLLAPRLGSPDPTVRLATARLLRRQEAFAAAAADVLFALAEGGPLRFDAIAALPTAAQAPALARLAAGGDPAAWVQIGACEADPDRASVGRDALAILADSPDRAVATEAQRRAHR